MKPRALVFDAYGTLFDVHSVVLRAGDGIARDLHPLSTLWSQKQLEFTWLRALMERYEDFWNVTEAALRSAVGQLGIQASEAQLDSLMQVDLFPSSITGRKTCFGTLEGVPSRNPLQRYT
jgi:2-haloacid dehalogenase